MDIGGTHRKAVMSNYDIKSFKGKQDKQNSQNSTNLPKFVEIPWKSLHDINNFRQKPGSQNFENSGMGALEVVIQSKSVSSQKSLSKANLSPDKINSGELLSPSRFSPPKNHDKKLRHNLQDNRLNIINQENCRNGKTKGVVGSGHSNQTTKLGVVPENLLKEILIQGNPQIKTPNILLHKATLNQSAQFEEGDSETD